MYLALQLIVFGDSRSILPFILIKICSYPILRPASMIEINFTWYVKIVKLLLSQKSQFDHVEKITFSGRDTCGLSRCKITKMKPSFKSKYKNSNDSAQKSIWE